jgi:hypothetical protein
MGTAIKRSSICIWAGIFYLLNATAAETNSASQKGSSAREPEFKRFIEEKRALVKRLGEKHEDTVPKTVWDFFDAAEKGDWQTTSNLFFKIETGTARRTRNPWMPISLWGPIHDTFGTYEQIRLCNPKLFHRFGETIMRKIPPGSIYFGGTSAGRFIVSALSTSHTEGRPFFTLTQNALADGSYLDYLRDMYGGKIYIPTVDDSQQVFQNYLSDARKRLENHQLKQDENVQIVNGRIQVSGIVGVMAINELLVRFIVEKNPSQEIYVEESYPLESLYAQSVPHGLIFKVNHEKMKLLPQAAVDADHHFWTDECKSLTGDSINEGSSVAELCVWTEKVFLDPTAHAFNGDRVYIQDALAPGYWSQCRSAIAGYYEWWSRNSAESQRTKVAKEADFAYRQSVALSPYNPTVSWRYANFLFQNQRTNEAKVLIETTIKLNPEKRMEIDTDQLNGALRKLHDEAKRLSAN